MNTKQEVAQKILEADNQAKFAKALGFDITSNAIQKDVTYYKNILENCKIIEKEIAK